jgi:hypothetical protein
LNPFLSKHIVLTLILIFIGNVLNKQLFAQSTINLGIKLGGSKLLGEIPGNFSEIINEFDNKTGFATALEISKYISQQWEIGTEIGYSNLKGSTLTSEFSAEGLQAGIPKEIIDPTEFNNKIFGQNFFFRYYFKPAFSESVFIPFIRAGGGYLNYNSQFKYIDAPDDDLLFGKGTEGYTKLSTPVFFFGTGFKSTISSHIYLVTSIDFNLVNYDFLDVVHNYNDEGNRLDLIGLYTEFKVGIFYSFYNPNNLKNSRNIKKKSKNEGSSSNSHLPFSR